MARQNESEVFDEVSIPSDPPTPTLLPSLQYKCKNVVKKVQVTEDQNNSVGRCIVCDRLFPIDCIFSNPCCQEKNFCLNCFLKDYRTLEGTVYTTNTIIQCPSCLALFPNPLAPSSDIESLIKINQTKTLQVRSTDRIWNFSS